MPVRAPMANGPWCFRCRYVMSSGPAAEVDLVSSIAIMVMLVVKGGGGSVLGVVCVVVCLVFCLLCCTVVVK